MRTAYREDEDEIARHEDDDREVTLSSTTVLLIFFGLVLVCGLCFGLGYTLGHRSTPEGAISAPIQSQPQQVASNSGQPKPSAAAITPAPVSDVPSRASDTIDPDQTAAQTAAPKAVARATNPDAGHETSRETTPTPAIKPANTPTQSQTNPQLKPALAPTSPATQPHPSASPASPAASAPTSPTPVPSGIMVQVAAVSNATDAQVLVGALRRHGFSASVHSQTTDSLLHIQVGPFASRADAAAMKQKLLAEGYNAIVK